jgi:hypothetical protein
MQKNYDPLLLVREQLNDKSDFQQSKQSIKNFWQN